MKNISMKKVLVFLLVALLVVSLSSVCFAKVVVNPNDFTPNAGEAETPIMEVANLVLGVIQVIGVAVAVAMLVVLAIKYISAAPAEKADIKKSAFIYVVGALLLFGGVAVLNIIQNTGEDIADATAMVVYENR